MRAGEDPGSLKMTIAQYLTPGDVSIQETGITPDVLLLPGRALKEQVNYFAPPRSMGEVDLDRHLSNPGDRANGGAAAADAPRRRAEKPSFELRYLLDEKEDAVAKQLKKEAESELSPEQQEDEESDADPDEFVEDYQIRFAADLVRRAPTAFDRPRLLEAARALVAERSADETARLEKRLKELGVDWSTTAVASGSPKAVVTMSPPSSKDVRAGETMPWTMTIENRGDAPFYRLRGWTSSDKNGLLDRREFLFGAVRPGERRSWTVPVKMPRALYTGRDEVVVHFDDDGGPAPTDLTTSVGVVEVPKPVFAFSVQVDDRQGGNGDGLPQRGETFTIRVDVKNEGPGASGEKTVVSLKNLGDEKLFITKGRDVIGAMKPGEVRSAALEVELRSGSTSETLPIRVTVGDDKTFEYISEELDLPLAKAGPALAPAGGAVKVTATEAQLRSGASPTAPLLATAKAGAVMPVLGKVGSYYCVEWRKGRMAFAGPADVTATKTPRLSGTIAEAWQREPPRIALSPDPLKGAPVVETDTWHLSGSATLPTSADPSARLRDLFILVNDQKVFFKVQPDNASTTRMDFATDIPLKPGINLVAVFAREDEEFQSVRRVAVYRRPPPTIATEARKATEQEKAQ
jgi:carboxyl-terminal processing protease